MSELSHIVCCDPGRALCGMDVLGQAVLLLHPDKSANPCLACISRDVLGVRCSAECPGPDAES